MRILIVDDEVESCTYLNEFISRLNIKYGEIETLAAYNGSEALNILKNREIDLVISDVTMPGISGIDLAREILQNYRKKEIILISGKNEVIESINSLDIGIRDFLTKPVDINKLAKIIREINVCHNENRVTFSDEYFLNAPDSGFFCLDDYVFPDKLALSSKDMGMVGIYSDKMSLIYNKLKKIHEYIHIPILIQGETGTGKEIIAKFIHYENPEISGPFIGLNCSNLSKELFESELFGYEKGAFTGAAASGKEGKIEEARNGTLFLDEVTETPLELQSKLLRVLQEREYYRIGGSRPRDVAARFIFASNKNMGELIGEKLFREDLYYRINICEVTIPPLRERKEEILPFIFFFLKNFNDEFKGNIRYVEYKALKSLYRYDYPGNVRELKNIITKAVLFSDNARVTNADVMKFIEGEKPCFSDKKIYINPDQIEIPNFPFDLDSLNRSIVKKVLDKFNGNKTQAAQFLGLTRVQFYGRFKNIE